MTKIKIIIFFQNWLFNLENQSQVRERARERERVGFLFAHTIENEIIFISIKI